jgi:hypothetical protein
MMRSSADVSERNAGSIFTVKIEAARSKFNNEEFKCHSSSVSDACTSVCIQERCVPEVCRVISTKTK